MFESFRDENRWAKRQPRSIRLFVEELEGRCLLSGGVGITSEIATDPNGNMWFFANYSIVEVSPASGVTREIPLNFAAWGMAAGADGGIWLTAGDKIDRMDPTTGTFREFALPSGSSTGLYGLIMAGPDGNLWFDTSAGVDRINPATGVVQEVLPGFWAAGMTVGADGNIWLTTSGWSVGSGQLIRLNPQTGATQNFAALGTPGAIISGPDGNLWYYDGLGLVRFNLAIGEMKQFTVPIRYGPVDGLAIGPDGEIWFNAMSTDGPWGLHTIGNLNPFTGSFEMLNISHGGYWGIATGPDGNIWFSESFSIGQYNLATGTYRNFSLATGTYQNFSLEVPSSPVPPAGNSTLSNNSVSATGTSIHATAGMDFKGVVATFMPKAPIPSAGAAYQATIDWGDGSISSLVLTVAENTTYAVTADHTYQKAGTYSIKVTIGNYNPANPLGDDPVTVLSMANVDPAAPFDMRM